MYQSRDRQLPVIWSSISMFFGLIIRMYFAPNEHQPPHFHVYYAENKVTVDIRTCEILEGELPNKQKKLVLAWAELHKDYEAFRRVRVSFDTIEWDAGIDLDPEFIYAKCKVDAQQDTD